MYGTNSFNLVWEDVCAEVFNNKLKTQLRHLPLPDGLDLGRVPKVLALVFFYKERVLAASKMLGIHTVFPALFSLQSLPPCEKSRHPDFRDTP